MLLKNKIILIFVGACALILATIIIIYFAKLSKDVSEIEKIVEWVYPQPAKARGAIVSNGSPCAEIGMKIMRKYENTIDSLIATMICDGVFVLHNMGIGGGFLATIYIKSESKVVALNARESAPGKAYRDMFVHKPTQAINGGLAIGVPGEIRGYWEMYSKYGGKAPWTELFTETIKFCENGIEISRNVAKNIEKYKHFILNEPDIRDLLLNENGELLKLGDKLKLPLLARTLRLIAEEGPDVLYNGTLTEPLLRDITERGGILTAEDMASYRVRWEEPVTAKLSTGHTLYSVPPPGSGPVLAYILQLVDANLPENPNIPRTYAWITEAFKFAYARRSELGDPHFGNGSQVLNNFLNDLNNKLYVKEVRRRLNRMTTSRDPSYYGIQYWTPEDHGTANIVALGPDGNAATATSTINLLFGSGIISKRTGIILNNEMDDFSSPGLTNYFGVAPSPSNFIAPGKRPMSSMCPSILLDQEDQVRLIVGAAGGTRITTTTALVTIWNVLYNMPLVQSIDRARFHHQLLPMKWLYEQKMDSKVVDVMRVMQHKTEEIEPQSSVTAISKEGVYLQASSDLRRPGNTSYLL